MSIEQNATTNHKLDEIQAMMNMADALGQRLARNGFADEANQAWAISTSMSMAMIDAVMQGGPVVTFGGARDAGI